MTQTQMLKAMPYLRFFTQNRLLKPEQASQMMRELLGGGDVESFISRLKNLKCEDVYLPIKEQYIKKMEETIYETVR